MSLVSPPPPPPPPPPAAAAADPPLSVDIVIIGAGLSGLTAAAYLKKEGIESFLVVDEGAVGGTWRDHAFPNAGTDTEVPTYYPSFLPTPETSSQYGKRDEIMSYFKRVAKEQIGEHKFLWGVSVASAKFDGSWWALSDASGTTTLRCRFLMPAIYSISCKWPHLPAIPNRDLFAGDVERFRGQHVAIIGCGASTIQIAPAIAPVAASVTVLRRTMPYIIEQASAPMPKGRLAWAFWRLAYELRNDLYTMFDGARASSGRLAGGRGSRRLEWLLRQWVRLCFFRKREAHTLPPASQPVQCTRRCYDYCGFIEGIRRGTISLVDASVNAVSSFSASGLVLRDGSEVRADSVIFATGYKTIGGDDTTDLHYEARRLGPTSAPPRLYLSLLSPALHGCPIYCTPPRRTEDSACRILPQRATPQRDGRTVPVFRKANSILFSPACASKRYAGRTPNSAKPTFTGELRAGVAHRDFNEAQGIPVPRLLFNLYMMAQRPLHCPAPTHGAEGAPTPPISASRPGFAAAVSLLGWLHGTR
ncbi:hypothetical protein EMIHUDRAFT_113833 [Emiliania huxleyi CCMP1516]|uniref:Flavin-containing monooxygenase n=2 Tax=Emiliania huxleyi TaxID=2903 RepID=A0A0D3K061_EMIH1|nr:hypothetical protein EMIHUDRAFT_113833 [Emiliania huxleyi CCMP1516]EOD29146.1 hypothetical protein EMIHUDRAFT_113833 [Emiliania huxleyi CCMP1516]|eukprot:XP_005781575.1 hypothetical protein EMIHUDRAFT_113833 [Emiliania huxleyi CCMP1516]